MKTQEPELADERKRLERLIQLMPVGERRAQLAKSCGGSPTSLDSQLVSLHADHDAVSVEWNRLFDQLEMMDQHTPEFDTLLAEWEKVDQEYKRLCDQIALLELTAHIRQASPIPIQIAEG